MQFTTVRSKEKDYYIYLKSKKLVHSNQEQDKNAFQLFGSGKKWFLSISSLTNNVAVIWRERKWIPAIWRLKNVVNNCQEQGKRLRHLFIVRKTGSQQLGAQKNVSKLFRSGKNCILAISSLTNTVAAIWRERKVDPCYLETKKCSSQLLGARNKIITSI